MHGASKLYARVAKGCTYILLYSVSTVQHRIVCVTGKLLLVAQVCNCELSEVNVTHVAMTPPILLHVDKMCLKAKWSLTGRMPVPYTRMRTTLQLQLY